MEESKDSNPAGRPAAQAVTAMAQMSRRIRNWEDIVYKYDATKDAVNTHSDDMVQLDFRNWLTASAVMYQNFRISCICL